MLIFTRPFFFPALTVVCVQLSEKTGAEDQPAFQVSRPGNASSQLAGRARQVSYCTLRMR